MFDKYINENGGGEKDDLESWLIQCNVIGTSAEMHSMLADTSVRPP